ncbi:MAG: hypothetical protein ACO3C5_09630 [Ilumatobacteraceae bacterium]
MRRLLAVACATAATVFGFGGWSATSQRAVAATANLTVVQQGFTVIGDAVWRVVVDIEGADSDKLNIDVVSHRRVDTRAELADALAGRLPDQLDRLRFSMADVPRNDAGRRIISVPTVANSSVPEDLLFGSSGVYPVVIELRAGESLLGATTTFVHHLDADDAVSASADGTLRVMNVAALSSAPARIANGKKVVSPQFSVQLSDLVDAYGDESSGAFVSLQGDQVAIAGAEALSALRAEADRHTFAATSFVPLNPGAMAEVGLGELFASQLRAGEDAITAAIGTTPDRGVIVVDDRLNANGAVLLRDVGVRGAILTPRAVDTSGFRGLVDSALTYRARAADGSTLLVQGIDDVYATQLADGTRSPVARAVLVTAGLVLQRDSLLGMGKDLGLVMVALGTEDGRPADPVVLQQLFRLVGSNPVLALAAQPEPASTETSGDVLELSRGSDTTLERAKVLVDELTRRVNNTISMLGDTDPRRNDWPAMLTTMLSSRTDSVLNAALEKNLRTAIRRVLGSLDLPAAANFTLSSRKAELRLQVRNTSSATLRTVVRFRSAKLKFAEPRQVVEVPANASAEVVMAVEARSNGRFPVTVQLLTPRGDLSLGEPVTITANVSAIAGLGQVVTATALLILLTWWAHNWRSRRRRALEAALATSEHPSRPVERANPASNK